MHRGEIEARGLKLSYVRQGPLGSVDGKTIVLVHGNSAAKEVFAPQFDYFKDKSIGLLAIDLPGHGASGNATEPETAYTIPGYADAIGDAISELVEGDYIVAGWSLGGHVALELAGRDNKTPNPFFKGLVIFGTPPVGPGMENVEKAFLPATFESATQEAAPSDEMLAAYARFVYGTLDPIPEAFVDFAKRMDGIARQVMVQHWMSGTDGFNQAATVATWEKPICVMHGNHDAFASLDYLKSLPWKNLWHAKVFEFPKCGHAPFVEAPAQFNSILDEFASGVL